MEDDRLKTQIRFGDRDLEVLTKLKGSQEPFRQEDLKTFIGDSEIPEFDFRLRWNIQTDRPPRRRVSSSSPETENRRNASRDQTQRKEITNKTAQQK